VKQKNNITKENTPLLHRQDAKRINWKTSIAENTTKEHIYRIANYMSGDMIIKKTIFDPKDIQYYDSNSR